MCVLTRKSIFSSKRAVKSMVVSFTRVLFTSEEGLGELSERLTKFNLVGVDFFLVQFCNWSSEVTVGSETGCIL